MDPLEYFMNFLSNLLVMYYIGVGFCLVATTFFAVAHKIPVKSYVFFLGVSFLWPLVAFFASFETIGKEIAQYSRGK